jgi:NADH dehydrogenase FAD-containing subunit
MLALIAASSTHFVPATYSQRASPAAIVMSGLRKPSIPSFDFRTLDTLISRGLDTVEDALLLARRVAAEGVNPIDCLAAWEDDKDPRPRILVIGSGWGAHALVKIVDADLYRLLVISPRPFFIFTPMLAASSVGTVEYRSITEPMRAANPRAAFIQGEVAAIDPIGRSAEVCIGPPGRLEEGATCQRIEYDICIFAAGVLASASMVPGVREHCYFLKELGDAQRLRRAVADALERASEPGLSDDERRRLLTLVVVGGGPTGVEYCGELSDFLVDAVGSLFPALLPFAQVVLLHGGEEVLPQFDPALRQQALAKLRDRRVSVRLNTRVDRVQSARQLVLRQKRAVEGAGGDAPPEWDTMELECGLIMWAAGTGPTPLTETLIQRLKDCMEIPSEAETAEAVSTAAAGSSDPNWGDLWKGQWLASGRLADPLTEPSSRTRGPIPGRVLVDAWLRAVGAPSGSLIAIGDASACYSADGNVLPQTAQVAAQQGAYVARLLNRGYDLSGGAASDGEQAVELGCEVCGPPISREAAGGDLKKAVLLRGAVEARPFEFLNLGLLAYLGGGEALSQVQVGENRLLSEAGSVGFLLWRSVYVVKQVSPRTRFLVLFDWFKTKLFGRDVTNW